MKSINSLVFLPIFILPLLSLSTVAYGCPAGWTCIHDWEARQAGQIQHDNNDWNTFGWNNRVEMFYNRGRTHNNCVYDGTYRTGSARMVWRGADLWWPNIVSSNDWRQGGSCVAYNP